MRLGIDFGTTRTIVAVANRGNYPIVTFENAEDDFQEWYLCLIASAKPLALITILGVSRCPYSAEVGWHQTALPPRSVRYQTDVDLRIRHRHITKATNYLGRRSGMEAGSGRERLPQRTQHK